jgi:hypothetical protein
MTVIDFKRKYTGQGGGDASDGKTYSQNRTVVGTASVTTGTTSEAQVLASPLIPALRSPHPDGLYLRASRRRAQFVGPTLWEIQIDYESLGGGGQQTQNPLDMPPKIRFTSEDREEEIDIDINGKPLRTITKEGFEPRIREVKPTPIITVTRNVGWVNPTVIADYRWRVNSDNWYGMSPGTVLIMSLDAENVPDPDFNYWTVTGKFALRTAAPGSTDAKAWYTRVYAQGYYAFYPPISGSTYVLGPILYGEDQRPVTKPMAHYVSNGRPLDESTTTGQWYEFQTKESRDFSTLGLI